MGMYDSLMIDVKCPKCGETSCMEFQTKETDGLMKMFKIGDDITKDLWSSDTSKVDGLVDCMSDKCVKDTNERLGYVSGSGYIFPIAVLLNNGVITTEYKYL